MNLLPKPLRTEVFYYSSDKTIDDLKETTQKFIVNSWILIGKFSSEYEFYLYPSFQIGVYSPGSFNRSFSHAFVYGKIYEENSKTSVQLTIRPNYYFILLFLLFPALFIVLTIISNDGFKTLNTDLLDMLYAPFFILLFCYFIKLWLRKKVTNSLHLTPKE